MIESASRPKVSVVIPTFNRPDLLKLCLAALLSQRYDPACYEIIIADDACSSTIRSLVEEFSTKKVRSGPALRYLPVEGPAHGPAIARNQGWRQACGEIIAFTDDDCLPQPDWLACAMAAFEEEVAGVCGQVIVPLPPLPTDHQLNYTGLARSLFVTANCFYRRSVLESVGGFDERFRLAWREDSDLFFNLVEQGYKFNSAPQAVVIHPVPPSRWGSSLQQQRKSFYNALLYKKHPALYQHYLSPIRVWLYYQIMAALLVTITGLSLRRPKVAWLGSGLWLVLTARFCLNRLKHTSHKPSHVAEMAVTSALIPPISIFWRLYGAFKYKVFFF